MEKSSDFMKLLSSPVIAWPLVKPSVKVSTPEVQVVSTPGLGMDSTDFIELALSEAAAVQLDAAMLGLLGDKMTVPVSAPPLKTLTLEGFEAMRDHARLQMIYAAEDAVMERLKKELEG